MSQEIAKEHKVLLVLDKVNPLSHSIKGKFEEIKSFSAEPTILYIDDEETQAKYGDSLVAPELWLNGAITFSVNDSTDFPSVAMLKVLLFEAGVLSLQEKETIYSYLDNSSKETGKLVVFLDSYSPWSISAADSLALLKQESTEFNCQEVFCDKIGARGDAVGTAARTIAGGNELPVFFLVGPGQSGGEKLATWTSDQFVELRENKSIEGKLVEAGVYGTALKSKIEEYSKLIKENECVVAKTSYGMFCIPVDEALKVGSTGKFIDVNLDGKTEEQKLAKRAFRVISGGKPFPYVYYKGQLQDTKDFVLKIESGEIKL